MAGVNQIFSLADDVARYVKACGKRSFLECKPLQGKINIEKLINTCIIINIFHSLSVFFHSFLEKHHKAGSKQNHYQKQRWQQRFSI